MLMKFKYDYDGRDETEEDVIARKKFLELSRETTKQRSKPKALITGITGQD